MKRSIIQADAQNLVRDYQKHGIEYISQVCGNGSVDKSIIKMAAHWLQSDKVFTNWAFTYIQGA